MSISSLFNIAALDWGSIRFGLAFGSTESFLVISYKQPSLTSNIFEILKLELSSRQIHTLIIGLPANFHGQPTRVSLEILDFIRKLEKYMPEVRVITTNERNTTQQAIKTGVSKSDKTMINHLAAQKILEHYLSSLAKNQL